MSHVVTFGEIMLRLSTPGSRRITQAEHFEVTFGGAEANVAVVVAQLGGSADFVTKLPAGALGQRALDELRRVGVGVGKIVRGGERLGVYFLEQGASQRPGTVIYDRAHSAIAEAQPGEFDWDAIFAGARWFHWSGITPAISDSAAALTADACAAAKRHGLGVSFDMNYRAKLWSRERAGAVLAPLMEHVDLCITSVEEARMVFGLDVSDSEEHAAAGLCARFGFQTVALTARQGDSASATNWGAMLFAGGLPYRSRRHEIQIVDRVGAGDSFSGALVFSLMRGDDPQKAVEFAIAASTLKHTIHGDFALLSMGEVEALAAGGTGGRVQR